jgi:hypothetical protein
MNTIYFNSQFNNHVRPISKMFVLPDGEVVCFAARVAEVDYVEAFRQGGRQLLDVLAQRVGEKPLGCRQASQLALTGSNHLMKKYSKY